MVRRLMLPAVVLAFVLGAPGSGAAAVITCPDPLEPGQTREYFAGEAGTAVSDCIYGSGNLNGAPNDAFLNTETTPGGDTYREAGWELVDSTGTGDGTGLQGVILFTTTNDPTLCDGEAGELKCGTWEILDPLFWTKYTQAGLGLKDGESPGWAVFFLVFGAMSGVWGLSSDQGELSHGTIYGLPGEECIDCEPFSPVPEPATLTMLGLGLLGAAGARRRMRKQA